MSTAVLGSGTFQDLYTPVKGKSEWGMDTLTRKLSGARSLLEAHIATLAQGDFYQGYYLQTWDSDDRPEVATITQIYKGLLTGGTPFPKATSQIVSAVGQTEADYSTEGDPPGLGRFYRRDLIASSGETPELGDYGIAVQFFRDRYALSARMDFTYRAVQTTYLYITQGRPFGPRYFTPDLTYPSIISRARITLNDGTVLPRTNWELFFGLTPTVINENLSLDISPVIGSPFFECQEIARATLGTP